VKRLKIAFFVVIPVAAAFLIGFLPKKKNTSELTAAAAAYRLSPPWWPLPR
jgi:hypothetical protein